MNKWKYQHNKRDNVHRERGAWGIALSNDVLQSLSPALPSSSHRKSTEKSVISCERLDVESNFGELSNTNQAQVYIENVIQCSIVVSLDEKYKAKASHSTFARGLLLTTYQPIDNTIVPVLFWLNVIEV